MKSRLTSVRFLRLARAAMLITLGLFLWSCDSIPSSPRSATPTEADFVSRALRGSAAVELHHKAKLLGDGQIMLTLRALCPTGFSVIEGPLTVMQGPLFQEIFGEGFFTTTCDGRWHLQRVRVFAPEGFQRGPARASASLMVEIAETGEFLQGDDNGALKIR